MLYFATRLLVQRSPQPCGPPGMMMTAKVDDIWLFVSKALLDVILEHLCSTTSSTGFQIQLPRHVLEWDVHPFCLSSVLFILLHGARRAMAAAPLLRMQ